MAARGDGGSHRHRAKKAAVSQPQESYTVHACNTGDELNECFHGMTVQSSFRTKPKPLPQSPSDLPQFPEEALPVPLEVPQVPSYLPQFPGEEPPVPEEVPQLAE